MSSKPISRRDFLHLAGGGLGLALVPSAAAQGGDEPAAVVRMTNMLKFKPDTVRIKVGETVRWKNTSVIVHTVTADPEKATMEKSLRLPEGAAAFHSGRMKPKETFEHTFETPGRYRYFCVPHEAAMRGTIIVAPADGES
ncbi:MAG: plastocyanin/azurin family copper-binding protein [Salinibacter sp.]